MRRFKAATRPVYIIMARDGTVLVCCRIYYYVQLLPHIFFLSSDLHKTPWQHKYCELIIITIIVKVVATVVFIVVVAVVIVVICGASLRVDVINGTHLRYDKRRAGKVRVF